VEQAHTEKSATAYRAVRAALRVLTEEFELLHAECLPIARAGDTLGPSQHDVVDALKVLHAYVDAELPAVELKGRSDYAQKLQGITRHGESWDNSSNRKCSTVLSEIGRAWMEVARIEQSLYIFHGRQPVGIEGLLEGSP
jgi:hypothetical protein